ncbi:uncharacterized protein FA14DRAFT_160144 [Meira miltonrushii]|uniref:Uncharacterized protein n=1 Tax=Meira miltonrushii TaxID=1280837 RepID=A0A316VAU1_9BASI|nr:uncharacterized protein FA14DRAFT_160144 [Meira miltonrushii]PWN34622.1 hypothetical protein FA14DRAFT_160144 [Meira miltonrushii]
MVPIKSLVFLAPFVVGFVAASNDHNSNVNNSNWDNSHSETDINQGAFMSCGMHSRSIITGGIGGSGNQAQNSCRRSEIMEEHLEARDLDAGFEAFDALTRRSNDHNTNVDNSNHDNSQSVTHGNGGAVLQCRRQDIITGGIGGNGNQAQNYCRRSTQLAIKDLGAVYRRMVERDLSAEEAEHGAAFLRRHATELGLLSA